MTVLSEQRRYEPPPLDACDTRTVPIRLPRSGHELRLWSAVYRNLIVNFSVVQRVRIEGRWVDVAKIQCDEGVIQRHQSRRSNGESVWKQVLINVIPPSRGWEVVDRGYVDAVQMMQDEWEHNLRRWSNDSA
jgi:hypothetical protein